MSNKTENLTVPQGDYGYNLDFTLYNADGTAKVLTDYTITLKVWSPGVPGTLLLEGVCDPDVAASGTCHYEVAEGDFDIVGRFLYEIELTQANITESAKNGSLTVVESPFTESV